MPGIGTLVNVLAIFLCGGVGMLCKKGMPARFQSTVFNACGAAAFLIGVTGVIGAAFTANADGSLTSHYTIVLVLSLVAGGLLGELLGLDKLFDKAGEWMKRKFSKGQENSADIGAGFANCTVLFCAGAMAILGAINDGAMGDPQLLFTKAVLDGIASLVFATVYGVGVLLAGLSVLVYQGFFTVLATLISPYLTPEALSQMSLVGSAVLMLIGFELWDIKKFKLANFIPAVFLPLLFSLFKF